MAAANDAGRDARAAGTRRRFRLLRAAPPRKTSVSPCSLCSAGAEKKPEPEWLPIPLA